MSDSSHRLNDAFDDKQCVDLFSKVMQIGLQHRKRKKYAINHNVEPAQLSFANIPEDGIPDHELLTHLASISNESVSLCAPGFLGFPDGHLSKPALVAAILEPFLNQNLANQNILSPRATCVEMEVLHWLRKLCGYPASATYCTASSIGGIFTPGGTLRNSIAVMAAREMQFPRCVNSGLQTPADSLRVLVPQRFEHYSIRAAMGWLSLGQSNITHVPSDSAGRMDLSALESTICKERASGHVVLACVAYAGDSRSMMIDDIAGIARVVRKYDIWFHVDACHGMQLIFSRKFRHRIEGIELAHSISFDPHKVLCVPYPCSVLLFRDPTDLASLRIDSDLILNSCWSLGQISPLMGSKSFMSLKLWCTIMHCGRSGLEKIVNSRIDMTQQVEDIIREEPHLELLSSTDINACMFCYLPQNSREIYGQLSAEDLEKISDMNHKISDRLREEGEFFVHNFPLRNWQHELLPSESTLTVLRIFVRGEDADVHSIKELLSRIVQHGHRIWAKSRCRILSPSLSVGHILQTFWAGLMHRLMKNVDHVALVYGSSVNDSNKFLSDIDIMIFAPDDFVAGKTTSSRIVSWWKEVMGQFGVLVDDELPLENKLLIPFSYAERAAASACGHLRKPIRSLVEGQGYSRKLTVDPLSNEVRARLVFNVLTVPTRTLSSTSTALKWFDAKRATAEVALSTLISQLIDPSEWCERGFVERAIGDKSSFGECFLGYKKRPSVIRHLKSIWSRHGTRIRPVGKLTDKVAQTVLIINGFPGVGKYSIAKELHKWIPDSRFVDNHTLIDLVATVEPSRNDAHHQMRTQIRKVVAEAMVSVTASVVFILTECLSSGKSDCVKFLDYCEVARRRNVSLTLVNLTCDADVHEERLQSSERISSSKTKLTNVSILRELVRNNSLLTEETVSMDDLAIVLKFASIDVTRKSVNESVTSILEVLGGDAV